MTEVAKTTTEEVTEQIEKQMNDRSYNGGASESGVMSASSDWTESEGGDQISGGTSGYGSSGVTAWEDFEGEIINLSTFKLECLQSSNIVKRAVECEISSIIHENGTPRLRKGNLVNLKHTDAFTWT